MNKRELLRQQLQLLAEQSKFATDTELCRISAAMCEVYDRLQPGAFVSRGPLLLFVLIDLLVHLIILIH